MSTKRSKRPKSTGRAWLRRLRADPRVRAFAHFVHKKGHVAIPIVSIAVGWPLAWVVGNSGNSGARCIAMPDQLPDPLLFAVGFVFLVMGRLFSYLDEPVEYQRPQPPMSRNITHFAMITVFAIFAIAWFFEAMGTARVEIFDSARAEAITFYIRCAIYLDKVDGSHGLITAVVIALLAFVTGHWLWADHPVKRKKKMATGSAATP